MTITDLVLLVLGYSLLTALFSVVAISVSMARAELKLRNEQLKETEDNNAEA
jgi:hypothetical protein